MRIKLIKQGRTCDIFFGSSNEYIYSANWTTSWRKGFQIEIKDHDNSTCLTVGIKNRRFFQWPWKVKYIISSVKDNKTFDISNIKSVKGHWQIAGDGVQYDYYEHFGHLKSIYKRDSQVAKVDSKVDERNIIYIDCNNDEDPLLLCGFILLFEFRFGSQDGGFDLGNLGGQVKEFDRKWKPD